MGPDLRWRFLYIEFPQIALHPKSTYVHWELRLKAYLNFSLATFQSRSSHCLSGSTFLDMFTGRDPALVIKCMFAWFP